MSTTRTDRSPATAPARSRREERDGGACAGHTSVFLVDDHPPIRKAIVRAINDTMDLDVTGEAGTLEDALPRLEAQQPDVVVADISLPDGHGLDLVKALQSEHPAVQTLIFSMYDEAVYAERALRSGASGYLMKTESIRTLIEAIRQIEQGGVYLSQKMAAQILTGGQRGGEPSFAIDELTNREFQVFQLLGRGHTVDEIQEQLDLSRKTVETYRRRAKEKLGVESVSELLQHAVQWTYVQEASRLQEEPPSEPVPV